MEKIHMTLTTHQNQSFEYTLERDQIEYYEVRFSWYTDEAVFAVLRDISDFKMSQLDNLYLSHHDPLTKVYNRRYFEKQILLMDSPEKYPLALAILDVNGLKLINDAFGHQIGDELLKIVAKTLSTNLISPGFIARIGGDEFAIVLSNTSKEEINSYLESVQNILGTTHFYHSVISVSVGVQIKNALETTIKDIIYEAEEEMYHNKIKESQQMREATADQIMRTLQDDNPIEKLHGERVYAISQAIAQAMSLDQSLLQTLEIASIYHDIGKIAVSNHILNHGGILSYEEKMEIQKHAENGYRILKSIDAYSSAAEAVLSHHERFDGKGYPRGLKGHEIPLLARIITLADAFESMTSHRLYRKKISFNEALEELRKGSGQQFDPRLVDVFEQLVFPKLIQ
jgi:diguanylate cyclase (GGDEF)-like protein